jgi:hypothetical protein
MKRFYKNIGIGLAYLVISACDGGPFCSEVMYQSMGGDKRNPAPVGCKRTHWWENYDCGDFGLGLCQKRIDELVCSPNRTDKQITPNKVPATN